MKPDGWELRAPKPVGCALKPNEVPLLVGIDAMAGGVPLAGAEGPDAGIGGSDSSNEAPKDDEGLNGLIPPKPVDWGCRGGDTAMEGDEDALVAPVGCDDTEEPHIESEKKDPVTVVAVFCEWSGPLGADAELLDFVESFAVPLGLLNENEEATLDISVAPGDNALGPNPNPFVPEKAPVCCCCCCCCS